MQTQYTSAASNTVCSTHLRRVTRVIGATATLSAAAMLAACGGGGDDRCSNSTTLFLSLSWTVNGVVNQSIIQGRVGQPLIADPMISGLPSSCAGKVAYSLPAANVLAPGLRLDSSTGRISGTATQAKSTDTSITIQPEGYFEKGFPFRIAVTL